MTPTRCTFYLFVYLLFAATAPMVPDFILRPEKNGAGSYQYSLQENSKELLPSRQHKHSCRQTGSFSIQYQLASAGILVTTRTK